MSFFMLSIRVSRFIQFLMRFVIPNGQYISLAGNRLRQLLDNQLNCVLEALASSNLPIYPFIQ